MAVRISDKLIAQAVEKIGLLYRKQLEAHDKVKPDVGDRLFELIYGPHRHAMELLPDCFFRRFDRIEVGQIDGKKYSVNFKLSSVRMGSYTHPTSSDIGVDGYSSDRIALNRTPQTEEIVDAILAWRDQINVISETRDKGQRAVKEILKRYASLPPAIKAFPPLVDLLSPEVRRKIEVPQHRLSSVEMELNPALKKLAADIAIDKILNR
jgi:hypothetical protein